jgi:hypothetical protein
MTHHRCDCQFNVVIERLQQLFVQAIERSNSIGGASVASNENKRGDSNETDHRPSMNYADVSILKIQRVKSLGIMNMSVAV